MKEKLYSKIYNDIITKIKSGEYKVGDKLPTEKQLAEQYGVSHTTTSRALKNLADTNLIYRIKKAGTFVNGRLGSNTNLIIPAVMPFEEGENAIMSGIHSHSLSYNIFTPFYHSKNNLQTERNCLKEILRYQIDGLIVFPCASLGNLDLYARLLGKKVPIVCLDRNIEGITTPLVTADNKKGMKDMVEALVKKGHKKIGFFSVNDHMAYTETERFKGFCEGIIENGLPLLPEYIFHASNVRSKEVDMNPAGQRRLTAGLIRKNLMQFLNLADRPTAICCINNITFCAVCDGAAELGLNLPKDLTIAAFDAPADDVIDKGCLFMAQDYYRLGQTAMNLIVKVMNGNPYPDEELVDCLPIRPEKN